MTGFYAGTFNPFTNGHLQVVKKAAKCFDKVILGMGYNIDKTSKINKEKMKKAIEETIQKEGLNNVEIIIYEGLTGIKAKELGADLLIRGLRNGTDYEKEENIAEMNEEISGIDTCYFRAGELRIFIIKFSNGIIQFWQRCKQVCAKTSSNTFK